MPTGGKIMFRKKREIIDYLESRENPDLFDGILASAVSGELREMLTSWGLSHYAEQLDWKPERRALTVQARRGELLWRWQFDPDGCRWEVGREDEPRMPVELSYGDFTGLEQLLQCMCAQAKQEGEPQ